MAFFDGITCRYRWSRPLRSRWYCSVNPRKSRLSPFDRLTTRVFSRLIVRPIQPSMVPSTNCRSRSPWGSNLNVVSGLDSKSDVSVGMNPSTGPRTRLERAGPRSGPARSQTWRSGCRVPGHTPSVSTRGVGSADYPPVRIFAASDTSRGELQERRSHKPGETFSRPNPTLSTPVFVNLRGASRDLPDQRSEFPMRGA